MMAQGLLVVVLLLVGAALTATASDVVELTGLTLKVEKAKPVTHTIKYPTALTTPENIGMDDKLALSFSVKNKATGATVTPHQVFVRLVNAKNEEIVYATTKAEGESKYQISLTPSDEAEAFERKSGEYSVEIILGDSSITPLQWTAAKVHLSFPEVSDTVKNTAYSSLPTFGHVFREPAKRASAFMSLIFTAATAAPTVLLLLLWAYVGANVSNFSGSPLQLLFHALIIAIFVLLGWYWISLTVFEFLSYVTPVSIAAIFAGSAVLSHIAKLRS